MKGRLLCFWLLVALVAPSCALADGCVIPATAFAKMEIPDQRALICYKDGKETLVIDTAFKGEGTNFAWIVPVPSKPEVEAGSPGLFATLEFVFQPVVNHAIDYYFLIPLFVGSCLFWFILKVREGLPLGKALLEGLGLMILYVIILGLFIPTFATAGSSDSPVSSVSVVERKQVGVYDTVTLSSADGSVLLTWLNSNGFATPTNYLPVIRDYAREGWFFVASKVRLDVATAEAVKPHPLSFKFDTAQPVYPSRLTGINNPRCKIELYVFGPGRAETTNFTVERCERPWYFTPHDEQSLHRYKTDELTIGHPTLQKLAGGSPVATKLSGSLSSLEMKEDAQLGWVPFREERPTVYSSHGAQVMATNVAAPFFVIAGLIIYLAWGTQAPWAAKARTISRVLLVLAVGGWLSVYVALPKVPVMVTKRPGTRNERHNYYVGEILKGDWQAPTNRAASVPDIAWVRKDLAEIAKEHDDNGPLSFTNQFSGQPMREEDSPGNYTLRETTNGVEYVWYDVDGAEHVETLFRSRDER